MHEAVGFSTSVPQNLPPIHQQQSTQNLSRLSQEFSQAQQQSRASGIDEKATQIAQQQIQNAPAGSTVELAPGNYGRLVITESISLKGADPSNPPQIQRIDASGAEFLNLQNLKIGNPDLNVDQIRNIDTSTIGIRVSLTNQPANITIDRVEVSGVSDGISISHSGRGAQNPAAQTVTITNSEIHDVRRDAINIRDIGQFAISGNNIHSIHPNYEQYDYSQMQEKDANANNAVLLPDGTKADHADGIQIANAQGGSITNNTLTIGNGTWYQGIYVHHEANSSYQNGGASSINISGNRVENNHDFSIKVHHFGEAYADTRSNQTVSQRVENRFVEEKMAIINERKHSHHYESIPQNTASYASADYSHNAGSNTNDFADLYSNFV